jgi:hypothetical protein
MAYFTSGDCNTGKRLLPYSFLPGRGGCWWETGSVPVVFTMGTYSHIIQRMREVAMRLLNDVFPAGITTE